MSSARVGLVACRCGRILCPLHDNKILVFCGLIKHPHFFPILSNSVRKNLISVCGTFPDKSSM